MEWLVIVLILLFVMAPVMWLKPSPRQKRQMALRDSARQQGVTIKMAVPPLHHFKGTMPAYRWRFGQETPGPDFVLVRDSHASAALEAFHAGWRWRIAPLRPLPESVLHPDLHLLQNREGIFRPRVVRRQDHHVAVFHGGAAHLGALATIAVSAASEHRNDPARFQSLRSRQ